MSSTDVLAAIERIRTDEPFAHAVVEQGEVALDPFDLTGDEQSAIVEALRLDLGEADEVGGFSFSFGAAPLTNLIGVGRALGGAPASQGASGWIEHGAGWVADGFGPGGQSL